MYLFLFLIKRDITAKFKALSKASKCELILDKNELKTMVVIMHALRNTFFIASELCAYASLYLAISDSHPRV